MLISSCVEVIKRLLPTRYVRNFKRNTMELSVIALLLLGFVNFSWQNEQAPRVKTSLGDIRGYYKISRHGRKYEAYEGIPYAQPPIGNLRFKVRRTIVENYIKKLKFF